MDIEPDAFSTLDGFLAAIRRTPYRLNLLIDEYDNLPETRKEIRLMPRETDPTPRASSGCAPTGTRTTP